MSLVLGFAVLFALMSAGSLITVIRVALAEPERFCWTSVTRSTGETVVFPGIKRFDGGF
jgi:hypothetical protein